MPSMFNRLLYPAKPWCAAACVAAASAALPAQAQDSEAAPADPSTPVPTVSVNTAQPSADPAPAVEAEDEPRRIDDITVTATKREEPVRRIPASINAISGEALENSGKQSLNDFIQESPGVVASQGNSGYTRISMRGISTDTKPITEVPAPVGVFIGDTAFTDPYVSSVVPDLSAFDLAGVQILKGPQGTLFGGAALSGAIRYELQEPAIGEWQARGFTQYALPHQGSGALTEGVALNVPVFDTAALRLGYVHRTYPGVNDDIRSKPPRENVDEGKGDQLRAIGVWEPSDRWKFKLTHLDQDYAADDTSGIADSPDGPRQTNQQLVPSPVKNSFGMDSIEVNYNFEDMRLVSLTSFTQKDADLFLELTASAIGSPPPAGYPDAGAGFLATQINSDSVSQELRFQSTSDSAFQWLVGGYWYDYKVEGKVLLDLLTQDQLLGEGSLSNRLLNLINLGDFLAHSTALSYSEHNIKSSEYAVFADLSYQLAESLKLSAGARFYKTSIGGVVESTGLLTLATNQLRPTHVDVISTERGVNPKLSLIWDASDNVMLYASAVKGFRFGGINTRPSTPQTPVPPTYKSDTVWNYELGLRTNWLENSLHADLTAFYIDYKNPIIKQQQGTVTFSDNVGAAISRGFEASLLWHPPIDGVVLTLAGGMTDAHTTETFTAANGEEVQPGAQMPGAAKTQYSGSLQYLRPVWLIDTATSVGYSYVGKGYDDMTHDIPINDYGTLNAGISLSTLALPARPRLSFNVSNILNATTAISGSTAQALLNPLATGTLYYLNPPRTYMLRLAVDF